MRLVIIDYDASNLHSVRKALQALGHQPVSYTHLTLPTICSV